MEKERITVFDMIVQIIMDGKNLSVEEEAVIREILESRERKRKEEKFFRTLSEVILIELQRREDEVKINESTKNCYHSIFQRCFLDTAIGNMDASEISESKIKKFIIEAHDFLALNRSEMYLFMGMLQTGLNKMSDLDLLTFVPDKKMYRSYIEIDRGIRYIDNPYTPEEVNRILCLVKSQNFDSRLWAIALWLSSNILLEEIVSLKKEDCWDSGIGKGLFIDKEKMKYVSEAFKIHPENERYIFMIKKNGIWEKMDARCLQMKFYHMCKYLKITYRSFNKKEAIIPDRESQKKCR